MVTAHITVVSNGKGVWPQMVQKGNSRPQGSGVTEEVQQFAEASLSRAKFNAANEKLIEDQLQVSEEKLFDYVPGEEN
jgi:hypothetical protein